MEIKYHSNLTCGIAAILFSVVLYFLIPSQIAMSSTVSYGVSSRTIPYGIAAVMAFCGTGLIIQSLLLKKDKVKVIKLKEEVPAALMLLSFIAYLFVFEKEWPVSTAVIGCISLALSKTKKWYYYLFVILLTMALYFVFVYVLHIRIHSVIFGS
ncbi:Tripartite tricarboxylate transporter TctB family [Lachnospiraceae bacterium JC7]|nr:Tripartite tricarboxylate transporter TctB family [Lachnospiraceae bacterium JC7]